MESIALTTFDERHRLIVNYGREFGRIEAAR
jgi:hypothetical protein